MALKLAQAKAKTLSNLKRLNGVARGYEVKNLNNFREDRRGTHYHEGWMTHRALKSLVDDGVVAKQRMTGRCSYYFVLPPQVSDEIHN